jgi:succinate-semialdehyde dehydrogenase/glutarate-semialdehyde dehydrogenase
MAIESVNPATGRLVQSFAPLDAAALEDRLARAAAAFRPWSRRPVAERAAVLARASPSGARNASACCA